MESPGGCIARSADVRGVLLCAGLYCGRTLLRTIPVVDDKKKCLSPDRSLQHNAAWNDDLGPQTGPGSPPGLRLYRIAALFFVLLYTFPAGMVLYWTANNLPQLGKIQVGPAVSRVWVPFGGL